MGNEDITIANTFGGALEIGSSVSVFLFGVVTLQTHVYFSRFPKDRFHFKALVRRISSTLAVLVFYAGQLTPMHCFWQVSAIW